MRARSATPARPLQMLAWAVIISSLLPAALLIAQRLVGEAREVRVAMVMDEMALSDQAALLGLSSLELAARYQALGLTGVALYEETIESLVAKGRASAMLGSEAISQALARGLTPPPVPADSTLVTALQPGALDALIAKNVPPPLEVEIQGRTWYAWPGDVRTTLPAGPDLAELQRWENAGFEIAYRPRNAPYQLLGAGSDFPSGASYIVYAGTQVAGHPWDPQPVIDGSQEFLTAVIEGTPQSGMAGISGSVPTIRLLSFNQDYVDRRLRPGDLVDKYLLAIEERNVRLLYLRPYTTTELGDPIANTEQFIGALSRTLARQGYAVGGVTVGSVDYAPNVWLRAWSGFGVLAALLLLAARIRGSWGVLSTLGLLLLSVAAAGLGWYALALLAALVFPVLGFTLWRSTPLDLLKATAMSLLGAALLVAVGSDRETLLAIKPFAGVGATLVIPPALFLFAFALDQHSLAGWLRRIWTAEVRFAHVLLALGALAAVALVVLRRGNDPVIGVSELELALRQLLGEYFARPRFKELIGHPLALLGLGASLALAGGKAVGGTAGSIPRELPTWVFGGLLTGGVIAQASILNSFSHYHTPLLVSLERTVVALVIGVVVGVALLVVVRLVAGPIGRWLARGDV